MFERLVKIRGFSSDLIFAALAALTFLLWLIANSLGYGPFLIMGVGAVLFLAFCLLDIRRAICLFIFLTPFHFVFKEIYPSIVTDLWREIYMVFLFISWCALTFTGKLPMPKRNILAAAVVIYLLWGIMEIFNSFDLVGGLAGFRYMFAFVPLYFIALTTLRDEQDVMRYITAILFTGFIIAVFGIIQVALLVTGAIKPTESIDFARKYSSGSLMRFGIPLERAISLLSDPNELGNYLGLLMIMIYSIKICVTDLKKRYQSLLNISLVIMFITFALTMSRNSLLGLLAAVIAILVVRRSFKPIIFAAALITLIVVAAFALLPGLFSPMLDMSDKYFQETLQFDKWGEVIGQAPWLGSGYSASRTAAQKLSLGDTGNTPIGAVDIYFLESVMQLGIIGFLMHMSIWFWFARNALRSVHNEGSSKLIRGVSLGIFGGQVSLLVFSLHTSPWNDVSMSNIYYVLGAISTFIYYELGSKMKLKRGKAE